MAATLEQTAEAAGADPADVEALFTGYPDDVEDLWEEEGVLSAIGVAEVHRMLNPLACRTHAHMYDPSVTGYRPPAHYTVLD